MVSAACGAVVRNRSSPPASRGALHAAFTRWITHRFDAAFARSVGEGVYELDIKLPQTGMYLIFVESRSQGVSFRQLPYLTLQTTAATATAGDSGKEGQK